MYVLCCTVQWIFWTSDWRPVSAVAMDEELVWVPESLMKFTETESVLVESDAICS